MAQKFFRVRDRATQLMELRDKHVVRGEFPGFDCLYEFFSLKRGYPLFIAGSPYSGKTEFVLELAVFTAQTYGWKWFVNLGETGSVDEQIAELSHKIVGKPYRAKAHENDYIAMTDNEVIYAHMIIDEHFVFCDMENPQSSVNSMSLNAFYRLAKEAENELGITFAGTIFDPFNDADERLEDYGGREDKYLKEVLKDCRIQAKKNNWLNILVNHIADIKAMTDKSTGFRYLPPALPSEWAGGRTWHRRAFTMILIYRPPVWQRAEGRDENYHENETLVFIQKSKPKGTGKVGVCSLFWDWKKNRFYENYMDKIFAHPKGEGKSTYELYSGNRLVNREEKQEECNEIAPF